MSYTVKCIKTNDYGRCSGGYSYSKGCYVDMSEYQLRVKKTGEILEPVYDSYWDAKDDLKNQADYYGYYHNSLEVVAMQPF